ncbi:MAG: hypothetical protein IJV64_08035, partial [Oscillospiraceae bacterium]|nr:hypothetical protein [Oscillospiraceae bacterium]
MDNESMNAMNAMNAMNILAATRPELFTGDNPPALVKKIGKMTDKVQYLAQIGKIRRHGLQPLVEWS